MSCESALLVCVFLPLPLDAAEEEAWNVYVSFEEEVVSRVIVPSGALDSPEAG